MYKDIYMNEIKDDRITKVDGKFIATCNCGKVSKFTTKGAATRMLGKGVCRYCVRYSSVIGTDIDGVYKNTDEKWCSTCSGCGVEQAYTRKDHAKQSEIAGWQCRACVAQAKGFYNNKSVGGKQRVYNKFSKSASSRGILWDLTFEDMFACYIGKCTLTGWDISLDYASCSASLDRIDSTKGYTVDNIQWVHTMVNMTKNKYTQEIFLEMCNAVAELYERQNEKADKVKW